MCSCRWRRAAPFLSGITVSGGEATLQPEFLLELPRAVQVLRLVTSEGIVGATR